jgi:5-hydroxyisourate hydrolase
MSTISTHILDTSRGTPAKSVAVCLEVQNTDESWTELGHAWTDEDGRVKPFFLVHQPLGAGIYRLVFDIDAYFSSLGVEVVLSASHDCFQSGRRRAALSRSTAR